MSIGVALHWVRSACTYPMILRSQTLGVESTTRFSAILSTPGANTCQESYVCSDHNKGRQLN